jgi:hypothetical protein
LKSGFVQFFDGVDHFHFSFGFWFLVFGFRRRRGGFDLWTKYTLLISRQQLFIKKRK